MPTLREWICARFPDYNVSNEPRAGTYGLVWILSRKTARAQQFSLKTVKPAAIQKRTAQQLREAFERELRLWLQLPSHLNVMPATFLDRADIEHGLGSEWDAFPMVRMPYADSTLKDWIGAAIDRTNILLAIAQTCNGLSWIYEHGIDGHGDIKPDNILLTDLRLKALLPDSPDFPSISNPWLAQISDFGWSNAWLEGAEFDRTWRPYLAPERLEERFVKSASDVFPVGVIACELLTGRHPAGDTTERIGAKMNANNWRRWASSGRRYLDEISPSSLRGVILDCLDADPSNRPSVEEVRSEVCRVIREESGIDVSMLLDAWTAHAQSMPGNRSATQAAWSGTLLSSLSANARDRAIREAEARLRVPALPGGPEKIRDWLDTTKMLWTVLLRRRHPGDVERAGELAKDVVEFAIDHFDDIDLRGIFGWTPREKTGNLQDFESWEPIWGYGIEALHAMAEVYGRDAQQVRSLDERLQEKYKSKQMTSEEFIDYLMERT